MADGTPGFKGCGTKMMHDIDRDIMRGKMGLRDNG
jgi:hypothetical protein